MFWTIKQNWDGKLWPRIWPSESFAWREIQRETGHGKAWVKKNCDWSLVKVRLVEVTPNYCSAAKNDIAPPPNPESKPRNYAE